WNSKMPSYTAGSNECCQQNSIGIQMVENAHKQPAEAGTFTKFLHYMTADGQTTLYDGDAERYSQPLTGNEEVVASSRETSEHLVRANRAVARMRERGSHRTWYARAQPYFVDGFDRVFYHNSQAVDLSNTYVVAARSNFLIDGNLYP
ncbi:hypothetical protein LTR16_007578, partial [Cryomyces antarcticus]